MNLAESILKAIDSALELWKTHLDKRKELYEISLSKKKNKALNYAEEGFMLSNEMFSYVVNNADMSKRDWANFKDIYKELQKAHKKFNKYD